MTVHIVHWCPVATALPAHGDRLRGLVARSPASVSSVSAGLTEGCDCCNHSVHLLSCAAFCDNTSEHYRAFAQCLDEIDRESLSPPTVAAERSSGSSPCFVATAVYGSQDAPEVALLRGFRDRVLRRAFLGRLFIRTYYGWLGPWAALVVMRVSVFRVLARLAIGALLWCLRTATRTPRQ